MNAKVNQIPDLAEQPYLVFILTKMTIDVKALLMEDVMETRITTTQNLTALILAAVKVNYGSRNLSCNILSWNNINRG